MEQPEWSSLDSPVNGKPCNKKSAVPVHGIAFGNSADFLRIQILKICIKIPSCK